MKCYPTLFIYRHKERRKLAPQRVLNAGFCWLNDLRRNIFHDKSPEDAGTESDNKIFRVYLHSIHGPRLFQTHRQVLPLSVLCSPGSLAKCSEACGSAALTVCCLVLRKLRSFRDIWHPGKWRWQLQTPLKADQWVVHKEFFQRAEGKQCQCNGNRQLKTRLINAKKIYF